MVFCIECGLENEDSAVFCTSCGCLLADDDESKLGIWKECPYCFKSIDSRATKCSYCSTKLEEPSNIKILIKVIIILMIILSCYMLIYTDLIFK